MLLCSISYDMIRRFSFSFRVTVIDLKWGQHLVPPMNCNAVGRKPVARACEQSVLCPMKRQAKANWRLISTKIIYTLKCSNSDT